MNTDDREFESESAKIQTQMNKFFEDDRHRNTIFTGTGNMRRCEIDINAPLHLLLERWVEEAIYFSSDVDVALVEEGREDITKLIVETNFLVFTIQASAALGEQIVTRNDVPEHQFILLAESFEAADGPPPLIWLFNQLTRKGQRSIFAPSSLKDPHLIHAYLKVYPIIHQNNKKNQMEVTFCAETRAIIVISFPSLLLKLVPVPKELIERQGSKALQQNMERDVVPGIRLFRKAFIDWM